MTETADDRRELPEACRLWWRHHLHPAEDTGTARRLRAVLRRAEGAAEILAEPAVHDLAAGFPAFRKYPDRLMRIVTVLAHVEADDRRSLAACLGADREAFKAARFQRLIRAEGDELMVALRRALPLASHRCNVRELAADLFWWGEKARIRWCFDYFGAGRPSEAGAPAEDQDA